MTDVPHDLPIDSKVQRLKRRYQGLSRVAAAINDLYIYGVYPSNFPNLTTVLEQAKDHCKEIIKETKAEIAFIENPNGMYDLVMNEVLEDAARIIKKKIKEKIILDRRASELLQLSLMELLKAWRRSCQEVNNIDQNHQRINGLLHKEIDKLKKKMSSLKKKMKL